MYLMGQLFVAFYSVLLCVHGGSPMGAGYVFESTVEVVNAFDFKILVRWQGRRWTAGRLFSCAKAFTTEDTEVTERNQSSSLWRCIFHRSWKAGGELPTLRFPAPKPSPQRTQRSQRETRVLLCGAAFFIGVGRPAVDCRPSVFLRQSLHHRGHRGHREKPEFFFVALHFSSELEGRRWTAGRLFSCAKAFTTEDTEVTERNQSSSLWRCIFHRSWKAGGELPTLRFPAPKPSPQRTQRSQRETRVLLCGAAFFIGVGRPAMDCRPSVFLRQSLHHRGHRGHREKPEFFFVALHFSSELEGRR